MANAHFKLSVKKIETLQPGKHSDGGGLYLIVEPKGAKRWSFLFRQNGRRREMGFGGLRDVPLATARKFAADARAVVASGGDPVADRRQREAEALVAKSKTFGEIADEYIKSHEAEWTNPKHRAQWRMTIDVYARDLHDKPVDAIETADILAVLKPIWQSKAETASRLRGRIEAILDAAKALKLRQGENPAVWRGNLRLWLARRDRSADSHHAALPYDAVPDFIRRLRDHPGLAPLALEYCILTAARSGEVLGAKWSEIDIEEAVWTIPAARMKGNREHRVPLSDRALEVLAEAGNAKTGDYVFAGRKPNAPLSNMALEMILRRMGVASVTVHGFRSAFRDWCGDKTTAPREIAEAALAHVVGDRTEAAYRRGDALERRRELMDQWANFCAAAEADNVVPIRARGV